jgi:hypothetical protein
MCGIREVQHRDGRHELRRAPAAADEDAGRPEDQNEPLPGVPREVLGEEAIGDASALRDPVNVMQETGELVGCAVLGKIVEGGRCRWGRTRVDLSNVESATHPPATAELVRLGREFRCCHILAHHSVDIGGGVNAPACKERRVDKEARVDGVTGT